MLPNSTTYKLDHIIKVMFVKAPCNRPKTTYLKLKKKMFGCFIQVTSFHTQ